MSEYLKTKTNERGWVLTIPDIGSAGEDKLFWNKNNLWLRSQIKDGNNLVSQGFGKFFNLGMGPDECKITSEDIYKATRQALLKDRKYPPVATLKLDGSLIIRSIYQNELIIRTRNIFHVSTEGNFPEVMDLIKSKYPRITMTHLLNNLSILVEWTTPTNQIVIRYPHPELTLIGAVDHEKMRYLTMSELEMISTIINVPLVEYHVLTKEGWEELLEELQDNKEIEGYVIRLNEEQDLVKVKSPYYLSTSAFKQRVDIESLFDLWEQENRPRYQDFVKVISNKFDEEMVIFVAPILSALFDAAKEADKILEGINKVVDRNAKKSDKDAALDFSSSYGSTLKFSLAIALRKQKGIFSGFKGKGSLYKRLVMQNAKKVAINWVGRNQ